MAAALALILALLVAGTSDYEDEKLQERTICSRQPMPQWCAK